MTTDGPIYSPAQRQRRCFVGLLVCVGLVAGAYAGLHSDRWHSKTPENGTSSPANVSANTSTLAVTASAKDKDQTVALKAPSSIETALASAVLAPAPR